MSFKFKFLKILISRYYYYQLKFKYLIQKLYFLIAREFSYSFIQKALVYLCLFSQSLKFGQAILNSMFNYFQIKKD